MPYVAALENRSLSTKLLLLTVSFILLAEIVVLIPSVAKQRTDWFNARIEAAYLVSLALEGPRDAMMDEDVARQLFSTANILGVTVNQDNIRMLILAPEIDPHGPPRMHRVDLRDQMPTNMIANSWATVFSKGDDLIQVTGAPRFAADQAVDIIVSQRALRSDLIAYARNILWLSLVISSLTAGLVFWALNRIIVRPVRRLTKDMTAFEADPDQAAHIHIPSARQDEIGAAERSLAAMQRRIYELLSERRRLAALGAGISKISHDLRNILASAQLMSDRLAKSDDPRVRKLSPRLISALDRAIVLSRNTLTYGRMEESVLSKTPVDLHDLVTEVFEDTAAMGVETENKVPEDIKINADRTQLYRSFFNLVRNSIEAMTPDGANDNNPPTMLGSVSIDAEKSDHELRIRLTDTGPGIPDHAREFLFEPFKGSKKPGGSGLGVAISAEIIRAHGGELSLKDTNASGAIFEIVLPVVSLNQ
ncbi:MAG: HAMP domain-containing sensor histidine kinase [Pseudomonadota bacterium]